MATTNNENTTEESDSSVLNLEYLTKKYQNLLVEYQQAVANYTNYIKQQTDASNADVSNNTIVNGDTMVTIKGVQYWGTAGISQTTSNSMNECKAACAATSNCSGAIYNAIDYSEPMCWLRSGESNIVVGRENDYSFIKKDQYLLSIIQSLNEKLLDTNQQITEIITSEQPVFDSNTIDSQEQNTTLINNYKQLTQEREKISQLVNEYQVLEQQQIQGDIKTNQNYYSFLLLIGLIIMIIFLFYKFGSFISKSQSIQSGGNLKNNAYFYVFGLISIVLLCIYFLHINKF